MSHFAFNIILIFFPGIICAFLVDMFTNHKERTQFQFVLNSFILGVASYVIFAFFAFCIFKDYDINAVSFLRNSSNKDSQIVPNINEIFIVTIIAIFLSILITKTVNKKWHFKIAQGIKITQKFAEQDVWGFLFNSEKTEWVTVRDIDNDIMYDGNVRAFSDNSKDAELLLEEVIVYKNSSGEKLYEVDVQYLSLDRKNISIELRSGAEIKEENYDR